MKLELKHPSNIAESSLCLLLAVIVCVIHAGIIGDCSHLFVFADEAGYWTHAAILAGNDWSGVSSDLSWYSYGYSLLLSLLIRIFSDTVLLYRAALVLNTVMIAAAYFLYIRILKEIFPKLRLYAVSFAAFAAVLYTPFQVQSGIAWPETLILFLMVLITLTILYVLKKPAYFNSAALGLLCAFMYMVHNRCIGIAAATGFTLLLAAGLKKIKPRFLMTFLTVLFVGFLADRIIRGQLEAILWTEGRPSGNDMGSTLSKLKTAVASFGGLNRLLSLLCSQSFASFVSTMGISLLGLWAVAVFLFPRCIRIAKNLRKPQTVQKLADDQFFFYGFVFCCFAVSLFITSIFMFSFHRVDHILYTRYFDMTVGILIAIGICQAARSISDKKNCLFFAAVPAVFFLGSNRAGALVNQLDTPVYNRIASPSAAYMHQHYLENFSHYALIAVTILGVVCGAAILLKKHRHLLICLIAAGSVTVSTVTAVPGKENIRLSQAALDSDAALFRRIETHTEPLYILTSCGSLRWLGQYALMDTPLKTIPDMQSAPAHALVTANASELFLYPEHELVDYSDGHIILSSDAEPDDGFRRLPLSFMHTTDPAAYDAQTDTITDTDSSPFLCYGPYFQMDEGSYTFRLTLSASGMYGETPGYAELKSTSSGITYAQLPLTADLFAEAENDTVTVTLAADVGAAVSDAEIVVFLNEPSLYDITLHSIAFRKEVP